MSGTSGPTSVRRLASYDPDMSYWRTSEDISLWDSTPSSLTLPVWGCLRNGVLYERPMPERLIAARESSSLLATPTAWLGRRDAHSLGDAERWHNPKRSNELSDQMAALFPTPKAGDGERGRDLPRKRPDTSSRELATTVGHLLPTPTAQAAKHGSTPDVTANGFGKNLWDVPHLLPTPTAGRIDRSDGADEWIKRSKNLMSQGKSAATLPLGVAVRELVTKSELGDRMRKQFSDGNPSSDDEHPTLPFPDEMTDHVSPPTSSSG